MEPEASLRSTDLPWSAVGTLSKLFKVWFDFPRVCICLCMHADVCNLYFSSQRILLQLIPHGPQGWESSRLVHQHVAIWTFFINTQESSHLRNCFQYLVASRTEGNCRYPASMWDTQYPAHSAPCCIVREQLLMQLLAWPSANHTL